MRVDTVRAVLEWSQLRSGQAKQLGQNSLGVPGPSTVLVEPTRAGVVEKESGTRGVEKITPMLGCSTISNIGFSAEHRGSSASKFGRNSRSGPIERRSRPEPGEPRPAFVTETRGFRTAAIA